MNKLRIMFFACMIFGLNGCTNAKGVFLLLPDSNGLDEIEKDIYIEKSANDEERRKFSEAVRIARSAIEHHYGAVKSRPTVHACISVDCYRHFGGNTEIAKVYGNYILISPQGFNWHFIAHEWSHAEMLKRLTITAWLNLPQWLDEGVAVTISEAPEHSEAHYSELLSLGVRVPTKSEIYACNSLSDWSNAIRTFGDHLNPKRELNNEKKFHVMYSSVGHEVRPWLEKNGSLGLQELIDRVNQGENARAVYEALR